MLEIHDAEAGLSLRLVLDPEPRDPRMVEEAVFQVVTWVPGLGEPHGWASPEAFLAAMGREGPVILPLVSGETRRGPVLRQAGPGAGPVVGYAFATLERLCMEFGLDAITPAIRDEVVIEARMRCLGELQAHEDYVLGEVYRYEVRDRTGRLLEARRDLYGEGHARHLAQEAFEHHLTGVG